MFGKLESFVNLRNRNSLIIKLLNRFRYDEF